MITHEANLVVGQKKICRICKIEKDIVCFSLAKRGKDGRYSYCKICDREKVRKWNSENLKRKREYSINYVRKNKLAVYQKSRDWLNRDPNRKKAHSAVSRAIKKGTIVRPSCCSKCNQPGRVEAHHDSYAPDKWLDVMFLCRSCHKRLHAENPNLTR